MLKYYVKKYIKTTKSLEIVKIYIITPKNISSCQKLNDAIKKYGKYIMNTKVRSCEKVSHDFKKYLMTSNVSPDRKLYCLPSFKRILCY